MARQTTKQERGLFKTMDDMILRDTKNRLKNALKQGHLADDVENRTIVAMADEEIDRREEILKKRQEE